MNMSLKAGKVEFTVSPVMKVRRTSYFLMTFIKWNIIGRKL